MTDHPKTPDLLVPDRSIVSIEQAKRELHEKHERKGTGSLNDFVTKAQVIRLMDRIGDGITEASLAVGAKMYEQASEELAANFDDFARQIEQRIRAEFERRSLRGRLRTVWRRLTQPNEPRIVAEPVDAVEALDPNVAGVVHEHPAYETTAP